MTDSRCVALCLLRLLHLLLTVQTLDLRGYLGRDVIDVDCVSCFAKVYLFFYSDCQKDLILLKAVSIIFLFRINFLMLYKFEDVFLILTLLITDFFVIDYFCKRVKVRQIFHLLYYALHV